jgi:hypothetical protein
MMWQSRTVRKRRGVSRRLVRRSVGNGRDRQGSARLRVYSALYRLARFGSPKPRAVRGSIIDTFLELFRLWR